MKTTRDQEKICLFTANHYHTVAGPIHKLNYDEVDLRLRVCGPVNDGLVVKVYGSADGVGEWKTLATLDTDNPTAKLSKVPPYLQVIGAAGVEAVSYSVTATCY